MKTQALGVDIGNVVIDNRLIDKEDKTLLEERYSTIPVVQGSFESLKALNEGVFQGNIFLISKCTEWAEKKILSWLADHDFYQKTGIRKENVMFCRERHEKEKICRDNDIGYFVDDRLQVLSNMVGTVPHLYMFQPAEEEIEGFKEFLPEVMRVESWAEAMEKMLKQAN